MTKARVRAISYVLIALLLLVVWFFKLGAPLIGVLFGCLALRFFAIKGRKWIAVLLYTVFVVTIFYGFVRFLSEAFTALPDIAANSLPVISKYAKEWGFDLPIGDVETLKRAIVEGIKDELKSLARFAQFATREFILLIIALVVAVGIFINSTIDLGSKDHLIQRNLYSALSLELQTRFGFLFKSFSTVMGAQIVISLINTLFTAIFVYAIGLHHAHIVVAVTFLCGLLPIVGNLISNSVIVGIAVTFSFSTAVAALIFLVALHKAEYFLNSRIIGGRIKNPMWLTLVALVIGETLMGIPGMILAPVILNYLKLETSQIEVV